MNTTIAGVFSGGGPNSLDPSDPHTFNGGSRTNRTSWQYYDDEEKMIKNGKIKVECKQYGKLTLGGGITEILQEFKINLDEI